MFNTRATVLLAAAICAAASAWAEPLPPVYVERYAGTYSTDCDDERAARLSIFEDRLVFADTDLELVAEDILTNVSYWGRMPPEGFELALIAGFKANGLVFLIHRDEQGVYILLEEDATFDGKSRYYKCESGETQHATPAPEQE